MDFEDLQRFIDSFMNEENNKSVPEFEGYSPDEMHQILNFPFDENSPLRIRQLSDEDSKKIPILNLIKYLAEAIEKAGEVKLTAKGFLPMKLVTEAYEQGFVEQKYMEYETKKSFREEDILAVNLSNILLKITGITKTRKGKLSLTKKGKETLENNHKLFLEILKAFTTKFNWAYFDLYEHERIGQMGWCFSLILLSKYGNKKQSEGFYAAKYFKAFPRMLEEVEPNFGTAELYASRCYTLRTFERFLSLFGFVKFENERAFEIEKNFVIKTELFDRLIKFLPHGKKQQKPVRRQIFPTNLN